MYNKLRAITFAGLFIAALFVGGSGMLLGAAGCGGSKKTETKTPTQAKVDPGDEAESKIEKLCRTTCTGLAAKCADADATFKTEECVFACADETDGVLDEAKQCLDKADDCDAARACRAKFDSGSDEE